tara:strand:- start:862 stop:1236 length:375 start_codon:yes stop_codon:yes gene_type:complete
MECSKCLAKLYSEDEKQYFTTLNILRESGQINMSGAPKELRRLYDMDREQSLDVFNSWREWLKERTEEIDTGYQTAEPRYFLCSTCKNVIETINYPIANQFDDGEEDLNGKFAEPVLIKNDNET